jgi:hypothetical protein
MAGGPDAGSLISDQDWSELTALFKLIEGCTDPFRAEFEMAEKRFGDAVSEIYWKRVHPVTGDGVTIVGFRRFIRVRCRKMAASGPLYPCI